MDENALKQLVDTVTTAVGKTVASIFNATPSFMRPVAMAALRSSVDSAAACFDETDRAAYEAVLNNLECVTLKIPKRRAER